MLQFNSIFTHQKRGLFTIVPALIGAIGTIGAGAISALSQRKQNKQNIQSSKDLAQYQWQNFDSPQAQMSAYRAAGVNPFAEGQLGSTPQMQVPDQQAPGLVFGQALESFIAPFANLLAVNSQIKNLQAQTEQVETATQGLSLDNDLKRFDLGEIKPQELKLLMSQIANTDAASDLSRSQIKSIAYGILKTQAETQGIDLKNRFQEMENEWKRIQGDRRMPESQVEWQELQNNRIRQQMMIDMPEQDIAKFRKQALDNLGKLFDDINKPGTFDHFMGFNLGEGGKSIMRAIVSMLLFKIVTQF